MLCLSKSYKRLSYIGGKRLRYFKSALSIVRHERKTFTKRKNYINDFNIEDFPELSNPAYKLTIDFGEKIGVAFQLADDVIDIASESNQSGKTPGTDLREGVPTLVTLNVMKSTDSADADLKQLLSAPIEDEATVQQVLLALRNHKALDQSRQQLIQVAKEARGALGPLPINDATGALMSLCDAVIDRSA